MADRTGIEWCDATWNPVVGCSVHSAGCKHCYAMPMAARHEAMSAARGRVSPYAGLTVKTKSGPVWNGRVRLNRPALEQPLRWKAPRRIFVNSMSDLFHEDLHDDTIDTIFAVMALAPQHQFLILTKRAQRMRDYFAGRRANPIRASNKLLEIDAAWLREDEIEAAADVLDIADLKESRPQHNVWLGVSAEDQACADERVPLLLETPAAKRFVSAEPLLGPIDFAPIVRKATLEGRLYPDGHVRPLDWIIVGGESGPGARPMHPDWVRSIRDQCTAAGVPFFFKQWGEWVWLEHGATPGTARWPTDGESRAVAGAFDPSFFRIGKKAAGAMLDGVMHREWPSNRANLDQMPAFA